MEDEIEEEAWRAIEEAKGRKLILVGEPIGIIYDDQSEPVLSVCTRCGTPVQSTMFKEKVLEIAKSTNALVELRCGNCLRAFIIDSMGRDC